MPLKLHNQGRKEGRYIMERNYLKKCKSIQKGSKGITLIALIITIVLNCWRSGRKYLKNSLNYCKVIIKNDVTLEKSENLL